MQVVLHDRPHKDEIQARLKDLAVQTKVSGSTAPKDRAAKIA